MRGDELAARGRAQLDGEQHRCLGDETIRNDGEARLRRTEHRSDEAVNFARAPGGGPSASRSVTLNSSGGPS
jgi:hypothetical protein